MKKYVLNENTLKGLLLYLREKPYKESAQIIVELSQLQEYKQEEVGDNGN
jgi:hypothetical protein